MYTYLTYPKLIPKLMNACMIRRVDLMVWETDNLKKDETWPPMNIPQFSSMIFMLIFHPVIVGISRKLKHESCRIFSVNIKNIFNCDVSSLEEGVMPILPIAV